MAEGVIATVDVTEAARRLDAGPARPDAPLLVDVREPNEFAEVRVPGARLMPLSGFAESYSGLPKDRPLLVMCAAGKRSLVASELLVRNGYRDVSNVDGGIIAWQREGYPTTSGDPSIGDPREER